MKSDPEPSLTTWEEEATRILRATLARLAVDKPKELRAALAVLGVHETERNLTNKISRGKFSFVFFLQCMKAAGVEGLAMDLEEQLAPATKRKAPPGKSKAVKRVPEVRT